MTTTPAFSDTYDHLSVSQLMEVFTSGPARLRQAIQGLNESDLRAQPRPGKWSIQQLVFHLADSDAVGQIRFKLALAQPGSSFPGYDQDLWVNVFEYQHRQQHELEQVVRFFEMIRAISADILRRASGDDWKKTGIHPERGEMTLRQLLELYADHSELHIGHILQIRKLLGKELNLPALL